MNKRKLPLLEWNDVYLMDTNLGMKSLPPESVDVVYADPPYNIGVDKWDRIDDFTEFNSQWISNAVRIMKPGGQLFIWGSTYNTYLAEITVWIKSRFPTIQFKQQFFWCKPASRPPPMNQYARKAETVLWFVKTGAPYTFNNNYVMSNIVGPCLSNISRDSGALTELRSGIHQTIKPQMLAEQFFTIHTNPGDKIVIPFAGSGSECFTALKMGRNFLSFELNPKYVSHIKEILGNLKDIIMESKREHVEEPVLRKSKRLRTSGGRKRKIRKKSAVRKRRSK